LTLSAKKKDIFRVLLKFAFRIRPLIVFDKSPVCLSRVTEEAWNDKTAATQKNGENLYIKN